MIIRPAIARLFWKVSRWSTRHQKLPDEGAGILIGAPHTSNWDFVLMLALAWDLKINVAWLGKDSLFKGPFAPLMRALGGIPVNRKTKGGIVGTIVERVNAGERFYLVITPDGTRTHTDYWKSGFYHIARDTGLPVVLGFVDRDNMQCGLGPHLRVTDDVSADMDFVREFYADKKGVRPNLGSTIRLRQEDEQAE